MHAHRGSKVCINSLLRFSCYSALLSACEPHKFSFSRSRLRRHASERYLKYKLRHSREGTSATDC